MSLIRFGQSSRWAMLPYFARGGSNGVRSSSLQHSKSRSKVLQGQRRRLCLSLQLVAAVAMIGSTYRLALHASSHTKIRAKGFDHTAPILATAGNHTFIRRALGPKGNLLIWGLGNDSAYWHNATTGRVSFLVGTLQNFDTDFPESGKQADALTDADNQIIAKYPFLDIHKIQFSNSHYLDSLGTYFISSPQLWPKELDVSKQLDRTSLTTIKWDVILFDNVSLKNRHQSIYTSLLSLTHPGTHVFINNLKELNKKREQKHIINQQFNQAVFGPPLEIIYQEHDDFNLINELTHHIVTSDMILLNHEHTMDDTSNNEKEMERQQQQPKILLDEGYIILLTVNNDFYTFFLNWWEHYIQLKLINTLYVVAEDHLIAKKLEKMQLPNVIIERGMLLPDDDTTTLKEHQLLQETKKLQGFNSTEYNQLVSTRATHILRHLVHGRNVLYTDVDTVWRKDPFPYFMEHEVEDGNYDMWMQEEDPDYQGYTPYYCTGFMAIKSNYKTIRLIYKWDVALSMSPQLNQPIFNEILFAIASGGSAIMKRSRDGHVINNGGGDDNRIRHVALPRGEFPNGKIFFEEFSPEQRERVAVVHNNYIVGFEAKKDRFNKFGLWNINSTEVERHTART